MVNLLGFNGQSPHSIILWQKNGEDKSKTVCYSAEDEQAAIERFYTPTDFYNSYDTGIVVYDKTHLLITHSDQTQQRGA